MSDFGESATARDSFVAGAFIASANTGTGGPLCSVGDFAAPRCVASGDTLNVTPTVSVS